MKVLARISYESIFAVWKIIARIAEVIYSVICVIDKWMYEHKI